MKATVELPDDLVIAAKKRAAELRRPLRALIEQGLRTELGRCRSTDRTGERRITLTWVEVDGGLPEGLDVSSREAIHEWLRSH